MSLAQLPEERIHDILGHLLHIPYDVFIRRGRWRAERTHTVLQVCRRWHRVGTPLLYECVVLTAGRRARAVARVLARAPHTARAVRCLKLAGELGPELRAVAQFLPQRLAGLYVLMALRAAPPPAADGLLLALPALRADVVVLQGALAHGANPIVPRVDATIARLIRAGTWPLHTFVVAQNDGYYLTDTLAAALAASPTLRRLVIDPYYLLVRAFFAQVATIATNPGLQEIACLPEPMFARNAPINLNEVLQRERNPAMRERLRGLLTYNPAPVF